MADKPLPWFRLYSEIISDRKINIISRETGRSKAEIIGAFTILMCLASESRERGVLMAADNFQFIESDFVHEFGIDEQGTHVILSYFQKLGMISIDQAGTVSISNWNKRQYKSDDSNERVTKYRQNQKQTVTTPLHDGYSNNPVTPPETETDSDTEAESDTEREKKSARADDFSIIQRWCEEIIRLPLAGQADILAITEMVKRKMIKSDLEGGYRWLTDRGKTVRGAASILEAAKTEQAKRIQTENANGHKSADKAVWADDYFREHPNG